MLPPRYDPHVPDPEPINAELDARILANPDDVAAFLAYADWLEAKGDPRAKLIRLGEQRQKHPDAPQLLDEEERLVAANRGRWLGGLPVQCEWRLGFLDGI